jgi:hypothetical protein
VLFLPFTSRGCGFHSCSSRLPAVLLQVANKELTLTANGQTVK